MTGSVVGAGGSATWPSCPCGSGTTHALAYAECCGPLHAHERTASTAEELMRSRYSAYATGDAAYLVRSWHPRTRPDELHLDRATRWTGLTVVRIERGGVGDDEGVVEFIASWSDSSAQSAQSAQSATSAGGVRTGTLHEVSRFERRAGRWLYVDGDHV